MRIIIFRHGLSMGNKNKKIQQTVPDHLIELAPLGYKQMYEGGLWLSDYYDDNPLIPSQSKNNMMYGCGEDITLSALPEDNAKVRMYTGPFRRHTQSGIRLIEGSMDLNWDLNTRHDNLPLFIDPFLMELDFGLFAGHDKETIKEYPLLEIFNQNFEMFNNPKDGGGVLASRPMGNNPWNVLMGCYVFMSRLMRAHDEEGIEDFVIVTSGATAKCLQICFTSDNPLNYDLIDVPKNGSASLIKTNPETHKNEYYGTMFNPNRKSAKNPGGKIRLLDDPEEPIRNDIFAMYPGIEDQFPAFFQKFLPRKPAPGLV